MPPRPAALATGQASTGLGRLVLPRSPRMVGELDAQRLELLEQLGPPRLGERRADADVLQPAVVGVQAQQHRAEQRPLGRRRLVQAVAGDHDVGGARVLDLEHRAAVRHVRARRAAWPRRRRAPPPRTGRTTPRPRPRPSVRRVMCTGADAVASASSRRSRRVGERRRRAATRRRARAGRRRPGWPASARPGGCTRDSAGWMRWLSASKSRRPSTATTISPSTTQRSGRFAFTAATTSGK